MTDQRHRLGDIPFKDLLPESIKADPTIEAAAASLDGLLRRTTLAIPKLLIWGRLDREQPRLTPPLARLAETAGGLRPLSSQALELLAWQLHVDFREVARNDQELEAMVRTSIPWHRIKGTPAAVEQALALYGITATTDESGTGRNWAVYELELTTAPTRAEVAIIVRVAEEAAPKRCWLRRIHDDHDFRPIIVGIGPVLGDGYLSDDSGVWNDEAGIKESFGQTITLASTCCYGVGQVGQAGQARTDHYPGRIPYLDKFILGISSLGDLYPRNHGIIMGQLVAMLGAGLDGYGQCHWWTGPWDKRIWGLKGFMAPHRQIHHRREVSRGQLVLGEGRLSWATERTDRRRVTVVKKSVRLGKFVLGSGEAGLGIEHIYLDEYFLSLHGSGSTRLIPNPRPALVQTADLAFTAPKLSDSASAPVPALVINTLMRLLNTEIDWSRGRIHLSANHCASLEPVISKPEPVFGRMSSRAFVAKKVATEATGVAVNYQYSVTYGFLVFRSGELWQGPWHGRWGWPTYITSTHEII